MCNVSAARKSRQCNCLIFTFLAFVSLPLGVSTLDTISPGRGRSGRSRGRPKGSGGGAKTGGKGRGRKSTAGSAAAMAGAKAGAAAASAAAYAAYGYSVSKGERTLWDAGGRRLWTKKIKLKS